MTEDEKYVDGHIQPELRGAPGIELCIWEMLKAATKDNPLTKEIIIDELCRRFPDRSREGMAKTVDLNLPNRINRRPGTFRVVVVRHPSEYWLEPVFPEET